MRSNGYGSLGGWQHGSLGTTARTPVSSGGGETPAWQSSSSNGMESPIAAPATGGAHMSAYCTPSHPTTGCTPSSGMAKPTTAAAQSDFKALQSQLKRLGASISVDGYLGPATLSAWNKYGTTKIGNIDSLAILALGGEATRALAKKSTPKSSGGGGPVSTEYLAQMPAPSRGPIESLMAGDLVGFIKNPIGIALTAGTGFVAYKILTKKKGSAASKPAAAPAITSTASLVPNPWPSRRRR